MLGLAVPLRLLPASDPRLVKTAQTIIRANNKVSGDPDVLARISYEPNPATGARCPTSSKRSRAWEPSGWSATRSTLDGRRGRAGTGTGPLR